MQSQKVMLSYKQERSETVDHARRTRFYGAMIDSEYLKKGKSYDGRISGLKEGLKEGRLESQKETAKNLSGMGMSADYIAQALQVSVKEFRNGCLAVQVRPDKNDMTKDII